MKKYVLEVDLFDNPIGKVEKQAAHTSPVLHRAFSVFLYHDNKLLIQKRAKHKYHSGGLWQTRAVHILKAMRSEERR